MLNCASSLVNTSLEGDYVDSALPYLRTLSNYVQQQMTDSLTEQTQGKLSSAIAMLQKYRRHIKRLDLRNPNALQALLDTIIKDIPEHRVFYLPAERYGETGHYFSVEVRLSDQGELEVCYLNYGSGIGYQQTVVSCSYPV